jgi:hypothetical protein
MDFVGMTYPTSAPTEAGLAKAGNRFPLFAIMLACSAAAPAR